MTSSKTRDTHTTARRLAKLVAGLNILLALAGVILGGVSILSGVSASSLGGEYFFAAVVYSIFAALILSRQSRHIVGWLFLIEGFFMALNTFGGGVASVVPDPTSIRGLVLFGWAGDVIWIPAFMLPLTVLLQFYPDGQLPSRRWWPVTAISLLAMVSFVIGTGFYPYPPEDGISNPFGLEGSEQILDLVLRLAGILLVIGIIGSLASVVVRFRKSRGIERAQMKWLVYTAGAGIAALFLLSQINPNLAEIFFQLFPSLLAIPIGLAILRYRLWNIDIIINRTLVYGTLTAILALLYFGTVTLAQRLFVAVTGQQSPVAIVISTLAIAALFNPLRHRIQDFIDQRFYRRKYDAEKALSDFSLMVREEVDLENLSLALLSVVEDTIQPESVSMWLKDLSE